jgi:catechol 2,3-dioxygenase
MEVKELGHVVLFVRNLEQSVHFYRDVLGFSPAQDGESNSVRRAMAFSSGRTHHEMLLIEVGDDVPPAARNRRAGLYHFGLKIGDTDDELRAALERLRAEGVRIVGMSDHTVTHSLYILDPDDNELELYIDVPGVNWRDPAMFFAPIKQLVL